MGQFKSEKWFYCGNEKTVPINDSFGSFALSYQSLSSTFVLANKAKLMRRGIFVGMLIKFQTYKDQCEG